MLKSNDAVDVDRLYREVSQAQHPTYSVSIRARLRFFLKEIERFRRRIDKGREELRVLDVACGIGKNAFALAHLGYDVYGLDNGRETLDYLRRHNSYCNLKPFLFDLEKDDYQCLPGDLDVIVVAAILEHLENPRAVLRQLLSRAASSCLVVGEVPNCYGASELAHRLRRAVSRRWGHRAWYRGAARVLRVKSKYDASDSVSLSDTAHIYAFSHWHLREFLREQGLQDIRTRNVNFLTGTPVIHKLFFLGWEPVQKIDLLISRRLPGCLGNGWDFSGEYRSQ